MGWPWSWLRKAIRGETQAVLGHSAGHLWGAGMSAPFSWSSWASKRAQITEAVISFGQKSLLEGSEGTCPLAELTRKHCREVKAP